jgi:subtilisin-like proprotein convertase family protein
MAAPGVAGNSLLVREYFERGFYPTGTEVPADGFEAGSALVKAMMINSGTEIGWDAEGRPITIPSMKQGWGRVVLGDVLHFAGDGRGLFVDEYTPGFVSPADAPVRYQLEVLNADAPLEVTLVWNDFPSTPAASIHLLNDLDLRVDGASGSYHGNYFYQGQSTDHGVADRLNNVEGVLVNNPTPGVYSIEVSPHAIPQGPQPYALVVSGNVAVTTGPRPAYLSHVVDDSGPNGNGDGVLDPGESAVISVTMRNPGDAAATGIGAEMYSIYPELFAVYGANATFPDIPVGGQGSSIAPHFDVTMQPDASCGQVLGAGMEITGSGFAVESAFTIDAGLYEGDRGSEDTPMSIPKTTAAIYSRATVTDTFPLTGVSVTVNIDHGDISELRVILQPPGGVAGVFLHNYSQPGVSGIHTTYPDLTAPDGPGSFADLVGIDPAGVWQLKIIDETGGGTRAGTLEDWTLHLKGSIPWDCNPVGCGEPVPNPVGDNLTVDKSGASDIVVSWNAASGASEYNVRRARDGEFTTGTFVGSTASTSLVDPGAQALPGAHYYLVRSVNSCRWESP